MGFWSSFRPPSTRAATGAGDPETDGSQAPLPASITRLATFGEPDGPGEYEALDLLRSARASSHEGLVLDGLMRAHSSHPLPHRVAIAVSSVLLDRGDRAAARVLLATIDAEDGLLLRADLEAEDGDLAAAIALIERVLVRNLDLPGARERRLLWRGRLGLTETSRHVDPASETLAIPRGRVPFDLLREVGRGGAGAVYAAKDRELGRRVALKIYHRPDRDRAQLLHEARVAVALEGPGIVRVFDVEPEQGWLALEWADLGALRDLLRSANAVALVPLDRWLPTLARALARVHVAGWVHHDVKPANVLMSGGIEPWLSDFGNARRAGEPSPPGSFGYVSPERLAGRASDPRDDVYALGRVIEDVLASVALGVDEPKSRAGWKDLAKLCVGPDDARPWDGEAVVKRIDAA